jgi:hypothetical protein
MNSIRTISVESKNAFPILAVTFLLTQTSPLLLFCLLIPFAFLFLREIHALFISQSFYRLIHVFVWSIFFTVLALWFNSQSTSKFGWRQILAGGGIQPPNAYQSILVTSVLIFTILFLPKVSALRVHLFLLYSSWCSFLLMAGLTIGFTGTIQYYAIKQFYVVLFLSSIFAAAHCSAQGMTVRPRIVSSYILILILSFSIWGSRVFVQGFMGTLPRSIIALSNTSNWADNPVDAIKLLKVVRSVNAKDTSGCILFRLPGHNSDLNSRWINALGFRQVVSEDCFVAFWNSEKLKNSDLIKKLGSMSGQYTIYLDKMTASDIKNLQDNLNVGVVELDK